MARYSGELRGSRGYFELIYLSFVGWTAYENKCLAIAMIFSKKCPKTPGL